MSNAEIIFIQIRRNEEREKLVTKATVSIIKKNIYLNSSDILPW